MMVRSFSVLPASLLSNSLPNYYRSRRQHAESRRSYGPFEQALAATLFSSRFLSRPPKPAASQIKIFVLDLANPMIPQTSPPAPQKQCPLPGRRRPSPASPGSARQPIALTAAALCLILAGVISIALWRAYTGHSPETDRAVAARALQTRTAQASEQLVEKTKGLEQTQQESIDQLQVVQDQLQTVRRLLASQQADTKRLSEQVTGLSEAIDGLRQSFASAQAAIPRPRPRRGTARSGPARMWSDLA